MSKTKSVFSVKQIALSAVLVALYVALASITPPVVAGIKITVEATPIIICAVLFGPMYAGLVGFLGELVNQMMTYGFTPTTLLWILPAVVRGVFIGLCMIPLKKKYGAACLRKGPSLAIYYAACLISAILVSCCNTLTFYVDSKMFGYYSYAFVFGAFWVRIGTGLVCTTVMALVTVPIAEAVKRAKLVS